MAKYTRDDLKEAYKDMTSRAHVTIQFVSSFVGGLPGARPGVEAFVLHHLTKSHGGLGMLDPETGKKVLSEEGQSAVARIMSEEVGDKDVAPEGGELDEKLT